MPRRCFLHQPKNQSFLKLTFINLTYNQLINSLLGINIASPSISLGIYIWYHFIDNWYFKIHMKFLWVCEDEKEEEDDDGDGEEDKIY